MAKSYELLRARMAPERRARNDQETQKLLTEMALQDLRQALNLSQAQLAQINQPLTDASADQRDLYVATLFRCIEALGGNLKLVASFPDREVVINQSS